MRCRLRAIIPPVSQWNVLRRSIPNFRGEAGSIWLHKSRNSDPIEAAAQPWKTELSRIMTIDKTSTKIQKTNKMLIIKHNLGISFPSEGRGHRFESCRVHHFFKDLDARKLNRTECVWKRGGEFASRNIVPRLNGCQRT